LVQRDKPLMPAVHSLGYTNVLSCRLGRTFTWGNPRSRTWTSELAGLHLDRKAPNRWINATAAGESVSVHRGATGLRHTASRIACGHVVGEFDLIPGRKW